MHPAPQPAERPLTPALGVVKAGGTGRSAALTAEEVRAIDDAILALAEGSEAAAGIVRAAVRASLRALAEVAPGRAVEIRVPPYGATQAVPGGRHTRGTPRASVEADGRTWLLLVTGQVHWREALDSGRLVASGERSDLSAYLPLPR